MKKLDIFLVITLLFFTEVTLGQGVGISETTFTPNGQAILDLTSSRRGFLPPRLELNGDDLPISGAKPAGLMVYNVGGAIGADAFYYWDGSAWIQVAAGSDVIHGSGTVNYLPKWTPSGSALGNSQLFDNGTSIGIGTNTPNASYKATVVNGNNEVRLAGSSQALYTEVNAGSEDGIYSLHSSTSNSSAYYAVRGEVSNENGIGYLGYHTSGDRSYGIYGSSGTFAGYFEGNTNIATGNVGIGTNQPATDRLVVQGGRVEFTDNTDASGSTGTGVLEIDNTLRFDGNEIITSSGTPLLINYDNNTNVSIDGVDNTFNLDAANNRVGIGTATPRAILHAAGNGGIFNLEGTDHTYIQFYPDGYAAGRKAWLGYGNATSNDLTITNDISGGRLNLNTNSGGITANSLAGAGTRVVVADLNGNLTATTSVGSGLVSGTGATNRATYWTSANEIGSSSEFMFDPANANISLYNSEASTGEVRLGAAWDRPGVYSSTTLNLFTGNANDVIIGTDNAEKARVTAGGVIRLEGSKNTNYGLEWYYGSAGDRYGIAQASGGNVALYTSNTYAPSFISFNRANGDGTFAELGRFSHDGNLGIGTTAPQTPLHVYSAEGSGSGMVGVIAGGGPSGNAKLELRGGSTPYFDFSNDAASDYDARIRLVDDDGLIFEGTEVGIGTSSPASMLHVYAGGDGTRIQSSSTEADIRYINSTGHEWEAGTNNSGNGTGGNQFYIYQGGYRMTVQNGTGNVGIGTTSPIQNLDVNGRIHVNNGVIQRGGTAITATNDLGLYSRINGNWIRIVSNAAPIRFFSDDGSGTNVNVSIEADGVLEARKGLRTEKRYTYFSARRQVNGSSFQYTLGAWDFCANAGQAIRIGDDAFDGGSDNDRFVHECWVEINDQFPLLGSNTQTSWSWNYDYANKPTWYMYQYSWCQYDQHIGEHCMSVCVNFDY